MSGQDEGLIAQASSEPQTKEHNLNSTSQVLGFHHHTRSALCSSEVAQPGSREWKPRPGQSGGKEVTLGGSGEQCSGG